MDLPSILQPRTPAPAPITGAGVLNIKPQMPPKALVSQRAFGDTAATRSLIFDNVLKAAQQIAPVSNSRHSLEVSDVHYQGQEDYSIKERKKAILSGSSLHRRLRGVITLKDKATGDIKDRRVTTLAQVPYLTDGGTFVLGGNEYTLAHQMRLRPGVFARVKENGEIESHVNVLPGKGVSHRYYLDPESGEFKLNVGQAKLPLMPLLRSMGVTDTQLREHWGNEIYQANAQLDDPTVIDKLHKRLFRHSKDTEPASKRKAVAEAFGKMELDPDVTRTTLGKSFRNLSPAAILSATRKLISLNKGEIDPDDRDHLAFQNFMGPEDLFAERLQRDKGLLRNILWKSSFRGDLGGVTPGMYTKHLNNAIMGSGLGLPLEEINPTDIFDQQLRVTRLGEGGIGNIDSVPDECYDNMTEVFTADGWVSWLEVSKDTAFACRIDGRMEFHKATRLIRQPYAGELYGIKTRCLDMLVTPKHRHWIRKYRSGSGLARCGDAPWEYELAKDTHCKPREFMLSCTPYIGETRVVFSPPAVAGARKVYANFDFGDWAEFVGWFVAEGCIDSYALRERSKYHIIISQDKEANPTKVERIEQLLTRMGIAHSYHGHNFSFISKQLGVYLAALGVGADSKHLPDDCFYWPAEARTRLLESLCLGDGSCDDNGSRRYHSTSVTLVHQVVRLATTLGIPCRVWRRPKKLALPHHNPLYTCSLLSSDTQGVTDERMYSRSYYTQEYNGDVHCAEVPGGLLLVRRNGMVPTWSGNSRNVQPSHLGFIDLIRTPESFKVGVDSRMASSARKGNDGRVYTPMWDVRKNQMVDKSPQDLAEATIAFPNQMKKDLPYVAAIKGGKMRYVPKEEVELELTDFENSFSPLANMIPMKSAVKGQRVAMGSRMYTQALALRNAEAPLVQSGIPGQSGSFESLFGKQMGAAFADKPGTVESVSPDEIVIKHEDGSVTKKELYNNLPYNRKSFLHNTPAVQPGQQIAAGQLLASSNFTSPNGEVALGLNPRIAFIPYKGKNYEDATVVSEDFAKRMTSEHMYQSSIEWDSDHKRGKKSYVSIFPSKYDRKIMDNIDDDGVIKPGTTVNYGDPLILAAAQKQLGHGSVMKSRANAFSDKSITWEHHYPGVVTDVEPTKKGATVAVKAYVPAQVGDKMCYADDTEILTDTGWKYVSEVSLADKFAVLVDGTTLRYIHPTAVHKYQHDGRMFSVETKRCSLLVTDNHKLYIKLQNRGIYELVEAQKIPKRRFFMTCTAHRWQGSYISSTPLPITIREPVSGAGIELSATPSELYVALLASYLAAGSTFESPYVNKYGVDFVYQSAEKAKKLAKLLDVYYVKYEKPSTNTIRVHNKDWLEHFKALNGRMPGTLFSLDVNLQNVFLEWFKHGNAPTKAKPVPTFYYNLSKGLADDLQRLLLHVGTWAVVAKDKATESSPWADSSYTVKGGPAEHVQINYDEHVAWGTNYSGYVYCVSLPHSHVVYVRRNGKPVWCGNSNRYGGKGVIAEIVPMDEMPVDKDGKPFEVLLNPLGVISRSNPAQVLEMALSKIALKHGRPEIVHDFGEIEDMTEWVMKRMKDEGLEATEDIKDPTTGRTIKGVLTGNQFMMKLHHTSQSKSQGRGLGSYTAEGIPAKGGDDACFAPKQKILTEFGEMPIATICEKRLGLNVKTFDFNTQRWCYQPITDWFTYRAKVVDMVSVYYDGVPCLSTDVKRYGSGCFHSTKNHNVYSVEHGLCRADELSKGDHLQTFGPVINNDQKALLLGSMLGDSWATKKLIGFEHSTHQNTYAEWKKTALSGLLPSSYEIEKAECICSGKKIKSRKAVRVVLSQAHLAEWMHGLCYDKTGKKTVSKEWLTQLTDLSVATWVLDDGCITNRSKVRGGVAYTGQICTMGFDDESIERLRTFLEAKYGPCTKNSVRNICCSAELCSSLVALIAANIPASAIPGSKKFLKATVEKLQKVTPARKIDSVCYTGLVPVCITEITRYEHDKPGVDEINVYDFTVASTHNYLAGKTLVSNSKRMAMMDTYALLSHGGIDVLRDSNLVRGQKNDEYWQTFMTGHRPPPPKVPFVYEKFINSLKASGINVARTGQQTQLMGLTNKDIDEMAGDRIITNAETVDWKEGLKPIRGGLFDPQLTGGHNGSRWAKIKLHEPMPNPVFEEPIRRLLGLTQQKFEDVIEGKEKINGTTGAEGIQKALSSINLDRAIEGARAEIAGSKKTARDAAIRKLGYLKSAQKTGVHPKDWIVNSVPVLPPTFRPVSVMKGTNSPMVGDSNYLYKELFDANSNLAQLKDVVDDVGTERLTLYNSFKAVTGLGDPVQPKNQEKGIKGLLKHIFGDSPKYSMVQQKLLASSVNLVGRSVITANPDLDMDEVGLPEPKAWSVYRPFVIRRLVRKGLKPLDAARAVEDQGKLAREALLQEMEARPVLIDRAPVLHKYGIMAFKPKLTQSHTLQINPIVTKGFGADFDGDQMNYHVPADDSAVEEALYKMLPSSNLFSTSSFKAHYLPNQEYIGGLYAASSQKNDKRPRRFATKADAYRAIKSGDVGVDDPIEIVQN